MKLFTKKKYEQLLKNGENQYADHKPVVKLFTPDAQETWIITEINMDNPDIAFGLCDLGMGFPELGCVSISEIESVRGVFGLPVERDLHFEAKDTISVYSHAARLKQRIVTDAESLKQARATLEAKKEIERR